MNLSVVVVSYNTAGLLERCLTSIMAHPVPGMEVLVVDNASRDGSVALVRERFPGVTAIANQCNVGFGAACNQAIRRSSGRYVALVNPDAEVQGQSLAGLMKFLDEHPRAAVAGGQLRYADGSFQHSAFRFPSLAQVFLDVFPVHWRLLESRLNGRYPRAWDERAFQIDHPLGAFLCARRAAIDEVGLFDEGFFMYVEEVDWCYRFKHAGWEVWHCPDALAIHHGGQSTRQQSGAMFVQLHRSRQHFYRKHFSPWFRMAAMAITCAGLFAQAAGEWWADRRAGGALPARRERARACLEALRL
ncbi:MAG: glycosyltransferase family 2 protein [Chloroflexota bacterium]